jgi:GNAT superfamily N-acetyltransferase
VTHTFPVRLARSADLPQVIALIREAMGWLAARGLDQWQGDEERRWRRIHADVIAGSVWVVEDDNVVIATITIDEWADDDFWRRTDHVHDALYAHRMAVARSHKGRSLGSALLDWASGIAERELRSWLRFDAWSTNSDLHEYYNGLGFDMVRNVPVEGRGSGALFQRKAGERTSLTRLTLAGSSAQLIETEYLPHAEPRGNSFVRSAASTTAASV